MTTKGLSETAGKLQIKEERREAFARLALHHLRTTAAAERGSPTHLDHATLSLMHTHGAAVWPAYAPHRSHLTSSSTVTAGANRGMLYAKASSLVRAQLRAWKAANDGREPDEDEQMLGSPLGKLVRKYMQFLANEYDDLGAAAAEGEVKGEEEVLADVLGEPQGT